MQKAYIANTGIISSIGANKTENLDALRNRRAGISMPDILQTRLRVPTGEIKKTNQELFGQLEPFQQNTTILTDDGRPRHFPDLLPRTALLSILAASEAWSPFDGQCDQLKIGFISANTVGGMDLTENFYRGFINGAADSDLKEVRYHECGAITELTRQALGLNCWSSTISTACSSSANSIMMATKLIEQGRFDVMIAGGADSLSRFTLNGFNSLMILDPEACQPFDQNRRGLNLGEGAAYLVLANEKALYQWKHSPMALISGYANANDAHHQTASSPEGKGNQMAMYQALNQAGLRPEDISYINLHGTGTENNDASEGAAIEEVFHVAFPPASSTKTFTGHTLGAAGAVEAVFSVFSIQEQSIWPHLRLNTPMQALNWRPETHLKKKMIRHVLSNSFGFGGNCSSLIISRI
jgi:3-oxoacyl-[acyl-carrier-protein] synthase-1